MSDPCKKSCCWTPYGTCGKSYTCDHHREDAVMQAKQDRWTDAIEQAVRRGGG